MQPNQHELPQITWKRRPNVGKVPSSLVFLSVYVCVGFLCFFELFQNGRQQESKNFRVHVNSEGSRRPLNAMAIL